MSSTLDDRSWRRLFGALLHDIANKVENGEVNGMEWNTLPTADSPPGFEVHTLTFQIRRT